MSRNSLSNFIKNKLIYELRDSFSQDFKYEKIVDSIRTSFPLDLKPQFGIIIENVSATLMRLSPDDTIGEISSFVFSAKVGNKKGAFLEWVREDTKNLFGWVVDDVSNQVDGKTITFEVKKKPVINVRSGEVDNVSLDIKVFLNNVKIGVNKVDGAAGLITLDTVPRLGSKLEIGYWYRNLEKPGIYILEMIGTSSVKIGQFFVQDNELLTSSYDGATIYYKLFKGDLIEKTEYLIFGKRVKLERDIHYIVDYSQGVIVLKDAGIVPKGEILEIEYICKGEEKGPFVVRQDQSDNSIFKGVVLAFGNRFKDGDKVAVLISDVRKVMGEEKGGKFELSVDMTVYARDQEQREEIADRVIGYLLEKKSKFDDEGVIFLDCSLGGEGEDTYIPEEGTYYFTSSVSTTFQADWGYVRTDPSEIKSISMIVPGLEKVEDSKIKEMISSLKVILPLGTEKTKKSKALERNKNFERVY